jgi:hypothetical protein
MPLQLITFFISGEWRVHDNNFRVDQKLDRGPLSFSGLRVSRYGTGLARHHLGGALKHLFNLG